MLNAFDKGLDHLDAAKARKHAAEQSHHLAEQRYGRDNTGYEYAQQNY